MMYVLCDQEFFVCGFDVEGLLSRAVLVLQHAGLEQGVGAWAVQNNKGEVWLECSHAIQGHAK